jgi:hypothetical protein
MRKVVRDETVRRLREKAKAFEDAATDCATVLASLEGVRVDSEVCRCADLVAEFNRLCERANSIDDIADVIGAIEPDD